MLISFIQNFTEDHKKKYLEAIDRMLRNDKHILVIKLKDLMDFNDKLTDYIY